MSLPKFPLVRVEWIDSMRVEGWQTYEHIVEMADDPDHLACESVGYLIAERGDRIIIANGINDGQAVGLMSIPTVAITSRTLLRARGPIPAPSSS